MIRLTTLSALPLCLTLVNAIQPGAAPALPAPLRHLEFGDLNFLHTTDTHGWHAGHLLEPSYSADWGDYISFSEHLRDQLEAEGKDLLLIDTGDRIEGNGLYDASMPRGRYTFDIFKQQHIDLICIGNHELYKNSSAEDDYTVLVPAYRENYIATNLMINDPATGQLVPMAPLYRKFTTKKQGIRVMAFGFIFDFTRNDKNTVVIPVEEAVTHKIFTDAVRYAEVDLFIVIGHVALRSFEFEKVHEAIRKIKPNIPIQFFGGHFHIRDYRIFDDKAHALASGRFMETIGFQSISNIKPELGKHISFARSYVDNNLVSYTHHSNTDESNFTTPAGQHTTDMITRARAELGLNATFGCSPQTYWMSRVPFPHKDSVFSLLVDHVFPHFSQLNRDRTDNSKLLIINTGAIRFDIFEGPFTRDSTYIVSPFTSNLSYIADVPYRLAKRLLPILNGGDRQIENILELITSGRRKKFSLTDLPPPEQLARKREKIYFNRRKQGANAKCDWSFSRLGGGMKYDFSDSRQEALQDPSSSVSDIDTNNFSGQPKSVLTPGYTTHDDLGCTGDNTLHTPITFHDVPNCIQALFPVPHRETTRTTEKPLSYIFPKDYPYQDGYLTVSSNPSTPPDANHMPATLETSMGDEELVDVVFNQFLTPYILQILNALPYLDPAYRTLIMPPSIQRIIDRFDFLISKSDSLQDFDPGLPSISPTDLALVLHKPYRDSHAWHHPYPHPQTHSSFCHTHCNTCQKSYYFKTQIEITRQLRMAIDEAATEKNDIGLIQASVERLDAMGNFWQEIEEEVTRLESVTSDQGPEGSGERNSGSGSEIDLLGKKQWTEKDVHNWVPGETFTSLLAKWVAHEWGGNCPSGVEVEGAPNGGADGDIRVDVHIDL